MAEIEVPKGAEHRKGPMESADRAEPNRSASESPWTRAFNAAHAAALRAGEAAGHIAAGILPNVDLIHDHSSPSAPEGPAPKSPKTPQAEKPEGPAPKKPKALRPELPGPDFTPAR
jgi:hypothetical protein